jgi:hypothetical protein
MECVHLKLSLSAVAFFFAPILLHSQVLHPAFTRQNTMIPFVVPGAKATYPLSINDSNTVTGSWIDQAGVVHGFVRDAVGTITKFDVPGSLLTEPASINSRGDITGHYEVPSGYTGDLAFLSTIPFGFVRTADGQITTFGSVNPAPGTSQLLWYQPVAIDDNGEIAGNIVSGSLGSEIFVRYPDGSFTGTAFTGADYDTVATGLNANGGLVAWVTEGEPSLAGGFYWNGQGSIPNPTNPTQTSVEVPNALGTYPSGSNAAGTVVGYYMTGSQAALVPQDFISHTDGSFETVTTPTGTKAGCTIGITTAFIVYNPPPPAVSINNNGNVIGCYTDASGVVSGFFRYENGAMATMTHPGSNQTRPTAINDSNVVTGYYSVGSIIVGFLRESSAQ